MESFRQILIEATLRGTILLALAWGVTSLLGRRSAELRHVVWLMAVIGVLALPVLALAPRWSLPILPARPVPNSVSGQVQTELATPSDAGAVPRPARSAAFLLPLLWLAGAVALLTRELRSRRRIQSLIARARPAGAALAVACDEAARRLRLRSGVRCRISPDARVPPVHGVWNPVVLLPDDAPHSTAPSIRRALLHELAHVQRRDPLWIALAHLTRMLFWFHPLMWIAVGRLRAESERACDDAVVREGERPSLYAETLLRVAERTTISEPEAAMPFVSRVDLESRITDILSGVRDRRALGAPSRLMVIVLAAAGAVATALIQPMAGVASTPRATPDAVAPPAEGQASRAWLGRAANTPPVSVRFNNDSKAPVRIVAASVRGVAAAEGDEAGLTMPEIELENRDPSRRVVAVQLALDLPTTRDRIWCAIAVPAKGAARLAVASDQWSAVVPKADSGRLLVHLVGAWFDQGDPWTTGEASMTPAVPPTSAPERASEAPTSPPASSSSSRDVMTDAFTTTHFTRARFRNPPDAAVVITEARTPAHPRTSGGREMTFVPEVQLVNRSSRRVVEVKLRFKADAESHAVTIVKGSIAPGATVVVRKDGFETWGRAADMTVQVVGARFEDGTVWGSMDSLIDARDAWIAPLSHEDR